MMKSGNKRGGGCKYAHASTHYSLFYLESRKGNVTNFEKKLLNWTCHARHFATRHASGRVFARAMGKSAWVHFVSGSFSKVGHRLIHSDTFLRTDLMRFCRTAVLSTYIKTTSSFASRKCCKPENLPAKADDTGSQPLLWLDYKSPHDICPMP